VKSATAPTHQVSTSFQYIVVGLPRKTITSIFRIRIEMAFSLMVKKWGILARAFSIRMIKIKRLVVAIARLHNFCINKQLAMLSNNWDRFVFTPRNATLTAHDDMLQATAAAFEWEEMEDAFEIP
jgi:hypothetical protein